jgi:hypothetical protein
MLRTFSDGSKLRLMSAKELVTIPVWKGNRIMDEAHANAIRKCLGTRVDRLDSSVFRIIQYSEMNSQNQSVLQTYLIDGQHRAHVLRRHFQETLCEPDFQVLVIEKQVESESDAIDFFNRLNNVKPQQWPHNAKLLTQKYIVALEAEFNKDKKYPLIRMGATRRPFLSIDSLREALEKVPEKLQQDDEHVQAFVQNVVQWNGKAVQDIQLKLLQEKEAKHANLIEGVTARKFALAYNPKLPWIQECL